jgi:hypothetical protein
MDAHGLQRCECEGLEKDKILASGFYQLVQAQKCMLSLFPLLGLMGYAYLVPQSRSHLEPPSPESRVSKAQDSNLLDERFSFSCAKTSNPSILCLQYEVVVAETIRCLKSDRGGEPCLVNADVRLLYLSKAGTIVRFSFSPPFPYLYRLVSLYLPRFLPFFFYPPHFFLSRIR